MKQKKWNVLLTFIKSVIVLFCWCEMWTDWKCRKKVSGNSKVHSHMITRDVPMQGLRSGYSWRAFVQNINKSLASNEIYTYWIYLWCDLWRRYVSCRQQWDLQIYSKSRQRWGNHPALSPSREHPSPPKFW